MQAAIPKPFPDQIADSILEGLKARAQQLAEQLSGRSDTSTPRRSRPRLIAAATCTSIHKPTFPSSRAGRSMTQLSRLAEGIRC